MLFLSTVLLSLSLALASGVLADLDTESSPLGLRTKPVKTSKRAVSSVLDRRQTCQGTCQVCFGASYRECPGNDSLCYNPNKGSGSQECSGGGATSATPTASASPGSTGIPETCYQKGASCVSCFGPGSTSCPAGSYYDCYQPDSFSEAEGCSEGGSTASAPAASPSASGGSNSCAATYGAGNIPCGQSGCYDPTAGESCCGDGRHCKSGTSCVLRGNEYKCADGGSGSSAPSLTSGSVSSRTASGILNTGTSIGVIGDASSESTSSSVSRVTRTTSSRSSTIAETAAAVSTGANSATGAAPALMGIDTSAVAALAAGLLGLMGLL